MEKFNQPEKIEIEETSREETIGSILNTIMTAEEYSAMRHTTPYSFKLELGDKELYYFGSRHMNDPSNPLFAEIENAFNTEKPDIVIVEGISMNSNRQKVYFETNIKSSSREEVIHKMGEVGFTLKLALENGIEWESPEPQYEDVYKYLLDEGFSKEEIFVHEVLHILPQYNLQMKREGFEAYVVPYIERFKEITHWRDFDYSYEHALSLSEAICGEIIDVEHDTHALDRIDPIPWEDKVDSQTVLNRIGEKTGIYRNRNIVTGILDGLKTYNRIFVVYGASHAVMQEPALKKAFERG